MKFDYMYELTAQSSIEIEDIGNVVLNAVNTILYQEEFLIIKTEYGKTSIIQYGPLYLDMDDVPNYISYTFTKIDFSYDRIKKIIDKFLNNPKFTISQVQEIELDEAKERIKDLMSFI